MIQDVSPRSWPYNSMINIQKAIENCNIAIENCHLVIVDLPIKNGDFPYFFVWNDSLEILTSKGHCFQIARW